MNKKGKHKKGKVPNPTASQEEKSGDNVEELGKSGDQCEDLGIIGDKKKDVDIIDETIQNLEEKIESVKEERVPEIMSAIITPVVDVKDEETPKKPKRNRGKKKKGKDDDFDDDLDEKTKEIDVQRTLEETKVKISEVEKQPDELPLITPTVRKKKNKKKNTEQKFEEPLTFDKELQNILTENIEKAPEEQDIKQDFIKMEIIEQEVKPSKKKKNKKKRNDSEKSDKEEFSCTAAFQKILDDKDELVDIQMEEKVGDNIISIECAKVDVDKAGSKLEHEKENLPIQPIIEMAQTPIKDEQDSKQTPTTEGRGKKKNKKDKKHTTTKPEENPKQDDATTEQSSMQIEIDTTLQNVIPEHVKEVITSVQEEETQDIATKESPKLKAKIAKPVEKKRKGKHEGQIIESGQKDISISESIKLEGEPFQVKLEPQTKENVSEMESKIIESEICSDITFMSGDTPDEDEKLFAQEFELIAEKAMGKKRKKGAKMSKTLEIGIQEQKLETDTKYTDTKEDIKTEQLPVITEILTPQTEQQEFVIMCEKSETPTNVHTVTELKDTNKPVELTCFQGKELLTPENIVEEKAFTTEEETIAQQTEDIYKTETKPGKKRKKSPKPSKKTEVVIEDQSITPKPEEVAKEIPKSEEITKQSLSSKIDASNITRMYDIEISSIKADESEGSTCDAIPDITYPRATSQQLLDDNNNTDIREIFPLVEPIQDTSLVQRCVETPKKEEIAIAPKEEKTDLKSKMIEVNQDMEELRLSIERSLAELTSMEKSEEAIEKEFEATRKKAQKVSNILFDTDESTVIQKPTDTEKIMEQTESIKETNISAPLHNIEIGQVIEGNNQKLEEKTIAHKTKKSKHISEIQKTTPTEENKIEIPIIESKIVDASLTIDTKNIESPPKIDDTCITIPPIDVIIQEKLLIEEEKDVKSSISPIPLQSKEEKKSELLEIERKDLESNPKEQITETPINVPPVCPARKENKGKNKKKKGKQETQMATSTQNTRTTTQSQSTQEIKKDEKSESKTETKSDSKDKNESKRKGKQQSSNIDCLNQGDSFSDVDYEPIENFEDALTSSADDVNKTFEMIVKESQDQNNPKINIIAPDDEKTQVSPPKNLLGHPDIPVRSNKRDYKKEKDKIPNEITAKVKIKDSVEVERKQSKNTQTMNKMKELSKDYKINDNDDFVYKYSFRKVFLQSACHVCKKNLSGSRVPCGFCNLLFYCSNKHKDEDWPHHQALCFAVSTLGHLKDQKHIYADAKNLTGHDYRLIRMQMIVSCEKVLKRRLVPWEQEALLYPRICADVPCREWRQGKLSDCQGCGQISFCTDNVDHFPKSHSRWCKSYSLYEKLVCYQQTKGRLEPKLPTKVLHELQPLPEKINEVLASMYEEKIDINDIQYAALTQLATAPLTAAYCHQICRNKAGVSANGVLNKKSTFTIHVVGAELQFEADVLNKWEVFFLHLRPDLKELRVVLINYNLNPSNLPLELLGKIKFCDNCRQNKRRVVFDFQDKRTYTDYKSSEDFVHPDIVCAFNPSIQRSSVYNGKDAWPTTINVILKLKIPFIITAYTITELHKDCIRVKECSETGYNFIAEPKYNNFASVRPDRNFISDDEMPLLFKNYCFAIISG